MVFSADGASGGRDDPPTRGQRKGRRWGWGQFVQSLPACLLLCASCCEPLAELTLSLVAIAHCPSSAQEQLADASAVAETESAKSAQLAMQLEAPPPASYHWTEWALSQSAASSVLRFPPAATPPASQPVTPSADASTGGRRGPARRSHPVADSAAAIERDRDIHRLGLNSLRTLPHDTKLLLLQASLSTKRNCECPSRRSVRGTMRASQSPHAPPRSTLPHY